MDASKVPVLGALCGQQTDSKMMGNKKLCEERVEMTLTALYINRPTVFRKQEIVPTQQWTKEEGSHSTFHTM